MGTGVTKVCRRLAVRGKSAEGESGREAGGAGGRKVKKDKREQRDSEKDSPWER